MNYNVMQSTQTTDANANRLAMLAATSQNNNIAMQANALSNNLVDSKLDNIYEASLT
jgi:hypothetical protein